MPGLVFLTLLIGPIHVLLIGPIHESMYPIVFYQDMWLILSLMFIGLYYIGSL